MGVSRRLRVLGIALGVAALVLLFAMPARSTRETSGRKHPNRIQVKFWHMWSAEWKDVVDEIVQRYNDSQDRYEVTALSVPGNADAKFLLGAIGGDPPDVMAQWNPVIPTWAEGGMLVPFEDLMSPAEQAQFEREAYPVVKRIGRYKDKTYGIPIGINLDAVYYLPQAFREAGIATFPTSWEGLLEDGNRLTKRDASGNIVRLGFLPGTWTSTAPLFGGGFYDFDHDRLTIDTPANVRCLQSLADARKELGYEQMQRFQAGMNTNSFAGGWPFIGGGYAAIVDGQWRVEQLAKYAPNLEYRTAPIPPPKDGVAGAEVSGGNFMLIPRSAKEKAGAWDFVKFWSGLVHPERAAEFYVKGGWLPLSDRIARAPIYQAYIKSHPQFATFVDAVSSPKIQARPPVAYQVFISDEVTKVEDRTLRGEIAPADAVHQLDAAVRREAARRKELGYDE